MKLSAITDQLRKLARDTSQKIHRVTLGGTNYTIIAGAESKFNPVKRTTHKPIVACPREQTLRLWKTEHNALEALRRQVATLGDDLCPDVRKRAEKLISALECGHYIHRRPYVSRYYHPDKRQWVEENKTELRAINESARLFARHLGREAKWSSGAYGLVLAEEEIAELSKTFIINEI
jgi:hypothetical protein